MSAWQGVGEALTWNELAELYDREHPGEQSVKTLSMERMVEFLPVWAETRADLFCVNEGRDGIYLRRRG